MKNKVLFLAIVATALAFTSCKKEPREVLYKVKCSPAECTITYSDRKGKIRQEVSHTGDWSLSYDPAPHNQVCYLHVDGNGKSDSMAACILYNGDSFEGTKHSFNGETIELLVKLPD